MRQSEQVVIGTFGKLYGTKGLVLNLSVDFSEKYLKTEYIYVDFDGIYVPFFFIPSQTRRKGNRSMVCAFQELRTTKNAEALVGKKVFIDSDLQDGIEEEKQDDENQLVGFKLKNEDGYCGTVVSYLNISNNPLFEVEWSDKSYYLPANNAFFIAIDAENRTATVKLPDGILDLGS